MKNMCYQKIRENAETAGYKVADDEFQKIVSYAKRKAETAGKDESYLLLLLPDVIREWVVRQTMNRYSTAMMEILKN